MTDFTNKKGETFRIYKLYYLGRYVYGFYAKSELAAKRKISLYCRESQRLRKAVGGVFLCNELNQDIAEYSPYFSCWRQVDF